MLIIYKFILKDWIQAVSVLSLTLTFYIATFTVFWYTQKGSSGNGMHSPYHSSRAIGLSAAQLYSHLDEEKSGSKRWAGQHSPALYVIKQDGTPPEAPRRTRDWSVYRRIWEAVRNLVCIFSRCSSALKALLVLICGAQVYFQVLEESANLEGFVVTIVPQCFNVFLSLLWLRQSMKPNGVPFIPKNPRSWSIILGLEESMDLYENLILVCWSFGFLQVRVYEAVLYLITTHISSLLLTPSP